MKRKYEVLLTLRVHGEWRVLGRFYLGEDLEQVHSTFRQLKGQPGDKGWIRMELLENRDRTCECLSRLSCTLDDLSENCRLITRDAFKRFNLEQEPDNRGKLIGEFLHMAGFAPF